MSGFNTCAVYVMTHGCVTVVDIGCSYGCPWAERDIFIVRSYVLEKIISIVAAYSVLRFFTRLTQILKDFS